MHWISLWTTEIQTKGHLDVLRSLEQPLVEASRVVILFLLDLKVDVALPQHLRHVEARLVDRQFVDGSASFNVAEDRLQLRVLRNEAT